ncbi:MAG: DUF2723 domain-containing protein [Actinobacteria bacterium]|nr:DUF2723 domain-containing protein [Actinomycetota bacterium]
MTTTDVQAPSGRPESPTPATRWVALILLGEVVLSAVLGSIRLGHKSLWYDEGFSAMHASRGVGGVVDVARHLDANMPLFALVLAPWRTLGDGEAAMRSLSVVCGALTVVAVFLLAARLFDRVTGLVAGFLFAIAPFAVQYSQQLRGYSMLLLLTVLGTWCFVNAIETRRTAWFVLYAVVAALAAYAHLVALFVIAAQAASLLFYGLRRLPWGRLVLSAAIGAVVLVPLAALILSAADNQGVTDTVTLGSIPRVAEEVAGGWALLVVLGGLSLVPVVLTVRGLRSEGPSPTTWRPALVVCGIVVPFLGVLGGALVMGRNWSERYVIIILPALVIGAAVAIRAIARQRLAAAVGLVVVITVLSVIEVTRWYDAPPVDDWRAATAAVLRGSTPDDGIVFCASPVRVPFEYYALRTPVDRLPEPLSPDEPWGDGVHLDEVDSEDTEAWATDPDRIWVVSRYEGTNPFGACDLDTSMAGRDLAVERSVGGITLRRYDR